MEVPSRIELESRRTLANEGGDPKSKLSFSEIGSSDEDEPDCLKNFDVETAKTDVYSLPGCHKIMLNAKIQKNLGIEVGVNVSEEFPWKQVQFRHLMRNFFDEIQNGEALQEFFVNYKKDKLVLMGYAPSLVQDEESPNTELDPFVIYVTEKAARSAAAIIKNIEIYERVMLNRKLYKIPGQWTSRGSEYEVSLGIPPKKTETIDVEIQSVYPMKQSKTNFEMRNSSDVRDGYIELIAGDTKFQNISRTVVTVGIQTAPATVTLEQQTDPTFPSNAWSQYLYEIKEEQDMLDLSSDEEQEKLLAKSAPTSKAVTPTAEAETKSKPPIEFSDQIKYLLSILEFNQIDMYRNDYPLIAENPVPIFTNPYLKEIFCFANISKSKDRYVSAVDWYPHMTGLVLTSYAFGTQVTHRKDAEKKIDQVQRLILEPNAILMWSFTDSLNFKLEFETPREVTALSFCPYDRNVVIGGTINGQIIIWDLQDRTQNLDTVEHLTVEEANNRNMVSEFLKWSIQYNQGTLVVPAAISALATSQTSAIIDIKWLSRNHYVALNGRIQENYLKSKKSRYFLSLSKEGSVAYWNLDYDVRSTAKAASKRNLPAALTQSESIYKLFDGIIRPTYIVNYAEPLMSINCEEGKFNYYPEIDNDDWGSFGEGKYFPIKVEEDENQTLQNSFIVGSYLGRIERLTFEGIESGTEINTENISVPAQSFARVHNGPIIALQKNPFYPQIFVSIGRSVMAIWKEDFPFTPILWRVRPKRLTAARWSTCRPAVLFLTRIDGSFEAWDLLERDADPCLVEVLGGGIITALSEHKCVLPTKVIAIGDYNSSLRMVALPEGFRKPVPNELERLQQYVEKEVHRKQSIQDWQNEWYTKNADIIEEKKKAKAEAARDLARLRLEEEEAKKLSQAQEQKKEPVVTKSAAHYDVAEKLDRKFDEMNLKRLIRSLMSRMRVDPEKLERETALEKEYLNYEQRKRASVRAAIAKVSEDIAAIRTRLLPVEKKEVQLSEIIEDTVKNILKASQSYAEVELEARTFFEESPEIPVISYDTIIHRAEERRVLLNQTLGIPYDRYYFVEEELKSGRIKDWDLGYNEFMKSLEECKTMDSPSVSQASYSDLNSQPESELP